MHTPFIGNEYSEQYSFRESFISVFFLHHLFNRLLRQASEAVGCVIILGSPARRGNFPDHAGDRMPGESQGNPWDYHTRDFPGRGIPSLRVGIPLPARKGQILGGQHSAMTIVDSLKLTRANSFVYTEKK